MKFTLDKDDLQPIIAAAVSEVLDRREQHQGEMAERLAFSESEAASLLGVARHTLRDCRLRGEISARKVGKAYRYSRAALVRWLEE